MEKKLRHSHQRDMIYNYLLCSKEHPSADKIYEDLRAEMPNLSLGTVYRNLKHLLNLRTVQIRFREDAHYQKDEGEFLL